MNNPELLQRYTIISTSINAIRVYNALIMFLGILSYCLKLQHFYLLAIVLLINYIVNYMLFRKMADYLSMLEEVFLKN